MGAAPTAAASAAVATRLSVGVASGLGLLRPVLVPISLAGGF